MKEDQSAALRPASALASEPGLVQASNTPRAPIDVDFPGQIPRALSDNQRELLGPPVETTPAATTPARPAERVAGDSNSKGNGNSNSARPNTEDLSPMPRTDPKVDADNWVARVEASLRERYVVQRVSSATEDHDSGATAYRYRDDRSRIAFTESTFRISSETDNPFVASTMIRLARARGWQAVRISGTEDFRRMVWQEASLQEVKASGYVPSTADLEELQRERQHRRTRHALPANPLATLKLPSSNEWLSAQGRGRNAIIVAIDAVLKFKQVPRIKRLAILAAVSEQLEQRPRDTPTPRIRVYDRAAPSQQPNSRSAPLPEPLQQPQRTPERAAPARSRGGPT